MSGTLVIQLPDAISYFNFQLCGLRIYGSTINLRLKLIWVQAIARMFRKVCFCPDSRLKLICFFFISGYKYVEFFCLLIDPITLWGWWSNAVFLLMLSFSEHKLMSCPLLVPLSQVPIMQTRLPYHPLPRAITEGIHSAFIIGKSFSLSRPQFSS